MSKWLDERGEIDGCEVFLAVLIALWVAKGCGLI